jgi:hypothetical protein
MCFCVFLHLHKHTSPHFIFCCRLAVPSIASLTYIPPYLHSPIVSSVRSHICSYSISHLPTFPRIGVLTDLIYISMMTTRLRLQIPSISTLSRPVHIYRCLVRHRHKGRGPQPSSNAERNQRPHLCGSPHSILLTFVVQSKYKFLKHK